MHHGVDHQRFSPHAAPNELTELREELGISGAYLLYLGAGDARKNLPLMVKAFAQSGVASDVSLVFAGPLSQTMRKRLQSEAKLGGVSERIKLLGYTDEKHIAPLYRH